VSAVLHAITTRGEQRRGHLSDAKLAVDKALHSAQSGEEWYLADHLRQGIKDVEARLRDASSSPDVSPTISLADRPERSLPHPGTVSAVATIKPAP
jgi:hypothetical protein